MPEQHAGKKQLRARLKSSAIHLLLSGPSFALLSYVQLV
jgi:hypothetical protein